ncbi:hypothetical protein JDS87_29620 [Bacillus cereus]|uniref:hypothetical protein n=1 Tax=Bacillus cereus TaxID=1396 RepID=UPI0018F6A2B5|nr:hypothetical protein [Bacillus cereus]MBJ8055929.1 hypothetical protein [Bacillus cereus]
MGTNLDKDSVKCYLESVHTYDSFARVLTESILEQTINQLGDTSKEEVHLTADIFVTSSPLDGREVCVKVGSELVCHWERPKQK